MATPQERHPELFVPVKDECPRGFQKSVPMQVLSFGPMRTGTATIAMAFGILGIKAYHSTLWLSTNVGDLELWNEALDAKFFGKGEQWGHRDFDQVYHDFGAACELPACAFVPELLAAYPEAKVVLVERDVDNWYDSFDKNIVKHVYDPIIRLITKFDIWHLKRTAATFDRLWTGWFESHSADEMRAKAKDKYRAHYAMVRELTPRDRLLEFKLEDGWEPLCRHLGKPVPDVPFPKMNEQVWLDEKMKLMTQRGFENVLKKTSIVVSPILVAGLLGWFLL